MPVTRSSPTTLSAVRPYASAREPQALLPIMPPIVHRLWVDGSGPKRRPWTAAARCTSSRTAPGSTTAVAASASMERMPRRCREKSTTIPGPTAFPAIEVPAPRAVTGIPAVRLTSTIACSSSAWRGKTTTSGSTRYSDASDEYSARRRVDPSTSVTPARLRRATTSSGDVVTTLPHG